MDPSGEFLTAADAARRLGVSAKALRLYEERGLIAPVRTEAGWRTYGPDQMERAAQVADLRTLGFSLAEVARLLNGEATVMQRALAIHEAVLEQRLGQSKEALARVRMLRREIRQGSTPSASELAQLVKSSIGQAVTFELPWPWGGETFHLAHPRPLTYIVGPLGSGKTRLAKCIAQAIPGAVFLPMERADDWEDAAPAGADADIEWSSRIARATAWLRDAGASASDSLSCLLTLLEDPRPSAVVVDMIEHGLDAVTQEALIAYLRQTASLARPVFMLTRSSSILDLTAVGNGEAIVFCPANHAPPMLVDPVPGEPGYEALSSCLATPEVRARTEGMVAWRPTAGHASPV